MMRTEEGGFQEVPVEAVLESMFSCGERMIAILKPDLTVVRVNPAFAIRGGHSPSYYVGKDLGGLLPDRRIEGILHRVAGDGEAFVEWGAPFTRQGRAGAETTYWDWSVQAVREDAGGVRGLILSCADVTERVVSARDAERRWIAGELHDGIAQTLSAVKYGIERSIRQLGEQGAPPLSEGLRELVSMLRGAIEEVRALGADRRLGTRGEISLVAAIHGLCREHKRRHGVATIERDIRVEEAEIPPRLKPTICRLLEIWLSDTGIVAGEGPLRLSLSRRGQTLEFSVEAEGGGASPDSRRPGTLAELEGQVEASGGSLMASSGPRGGTVVRAVWRLQP